MMQNLGMASGLNLPSSLGMAAMAQAPQINVSYHLQLQYAGRDLPCVQCRGIIIAGGKKLNEPGAEKS